MAVQGTDLVLVERAGALHKTTAQEVADLGGGGGGGGLTQAQVMARTLGC
jgi:hypothetical protein